MSARVVVIGFDAGDPSTARELAAAGRMPALARLLATGAQLPMTEARGDAFVAERWTTMVTGVGPEVHRYWCWTEHDPEARVQRPAPLDTAGVDRLWVASAAGRVAVLDVPRQPLTDVDGIQLCEWGAHDHDLGTCSTPPELAAQLDERFGAYPFEIAAGDLAGQFAPCDVLLRTGTDDRDVEQLRELAALVDASVEVKAQVSEHLLESERWDLFFTVFGESHCAAHQFWHLHEPVLDRDRSLLAELGDVVTRTYERLDATLGRHVELAGDDATVVVILHSGMGHPRGGNDVLAEVVERLAGSPPSYSTCAFTNQVGTIRLHLEGRDPGGTITRAQVPDVVEELTHELHALVDDDTGRPAVRAVRTRAETFPGSTDETLPDLFVHWHGDDVIHRVSSPTIGTVTGTAPTARTGDHHSDGLVVISGPGTTPGARAPIDPAQLAPMVAAMLDVDYPTGVAASSASTSSA